MPILTAASSVMLVFALGCLAIPGTTPHAEPAQDAGPRDVIGDVIDVAPPEHPRDVPAVSEARDAIAPGSPDAPMLCQGSVPSGACCGVFGFEEGTLSGFARSACCANAFSRPENLLLASLSEEGGCGERGLRLEATFLSADAAGCAESPFAPACASQIGEISAALPGGGAFDLRGQTLVGRLWLPADVNVSSFNPTVRAFAVGATGIVYAASSALPSNGWQSFVCPFPDAQAPALATVFRWGVQLVLRPEAIPGHQWNGPVWFDALGWRASVSAAR